MNWLKRKTAESVDDWFLRMADQLLNRHRLIVPGDSLRLMHVEFYLRSPRHPDPFVHGFDIQKQRGRWYLHRVGSGFRGGNYKGFDLTFGDGHAYGGILFRAATADSGTVLRGPSKLTDFILEATGFQRVADLDAALGPADDPASPVYLVKVKAEHAPIERRPRVGLSMKRATPESEHANFVRRLYGFRIRRRASSP